MFPKPFLTLPCIVMLRSFHMMGRTMHKIDICHCQVDAGQAIYLLT